MRILVFLHSFEPGGVERVALRLCRAWGNEVKLVMGRNDGAMRSEAEGLAYETLSDGRIPTAAWETLWMIVRLPAIIQRERPDILFCAGNSYSIVSVAMKLILGRSCPPIVAKISNDLTRADFPQPVRWLYRRWLRIQSRFIDRFVGMAPPMRAEIAKAMQIDAANVAIVDDPALTLADIDRLGTTTADRPKRSRFVAAGRLAPQKNFTLLLRAFAAIAKDDDTLTLLGDGPENAALRREAARLGISDRVTMPGHVPDLAPWLASADIFVLSSDYEGVPAVIAEALAAGLPIVATDCSVSMRDMLSGGALGQIVATRDLSALASAMAVSRKIAVDREAARAQARRFTVETAAERYRTVFSAALTPGRNHC